MEFSCSVCGYTSDKKVNVARHLNNKRPCKDAILLETEADISCKYCGNSYKTKATLKKHLTRCKVKKNEDDEKIRLEEKVKELENKLAEAEKKADKGPQTVINNYIQVNVNGYRETSFEHLTDRHFSRAVRRMVMSVPQMIQDVHFNPKVPENHNIYISNIKGKYAMVYDGEKWCVQDQDEAINQLINDQEYAMEDWLGEGEKFPHEMREFNRYLEKKENDEVKNVIKQEVKMLLYNNRNKINKVR